MNGSVAQLDPDARIYVAGHAGLAGSAILRALERRGCSRLITRRRAELDLREQQPVRAFFAKERPDYVFLAAARVGGILANATRPADFLYDNLMIQTNVIDAAWRSGAQALVFLGSTCVYPRDAAQPIAEPALLTGPLEPTNEAYAIAKIAGLKMCEAYGRQHGLRTVTLMPTNLYGPGDNFDLGTGHVLAALMRKAHEAMRAAAPTLEVWGSGTPRREFLFVDDLAEAALFALDHPESDGLLNVGSGEEVTIAELARRIAETVGFEGELAFDPTKPDGTLRKFADTRRLAALGWRPSIGLDEGLARTYAWYRANGVAAGGQSA
jgi:GDP-L-fucose synthase